jgi:hypothetical protein
VAVVEEFYINIIFKARLLESGVWYNRYNYTLRHDKKGKYIVLKQFKRLYNLVFLEYKALLTYSYIPPEIFISITGVIMFPTIERKIRSRFQRKQEYLKPRSDKEDI